MALERRKTRAENMEGFVMMLGSRPSPGRFEPRRQGLSQTTRLSAMSERFFPRDDYFMRLALREAERALEHDDVPIGAVLVHGGEVLASAHNERELRADPTAHAEMLALRE